MRPHTSILIAGAALLCATIARAQTASNAYPAGPTTFAPSPYSSPYTPVPAYSTPRTTYDEKQQSVFIVDQPTSAPQMATPGAAYPPGGTYAIASATSNPVYQPGQQFSLTDTPQPIPAAAPIAYSTIDQPVLPPGAVMSDCIDYSCEPWHWQLLPPGLIWHSYLAGPKEPRFATVWFNDPDLGIKWDGELGGRVALLRYGTSADFRPDGWELQLEGAAFIRQDPEEDFDVDGYDFRIGLPLVYGWGPYQMKLAWYHTSAHLGDEFAAKNPLFTRINFSRNALVWGHSYYPFDALRLYGEVDFAYWTDGGSEPWAFQFGLEFSPLVRGWRGAPFFAVNAHLREEVDFGGTFTLQTGWQWRGLRGGQLIRAGFHYLNGPSTIDEFFRDNEEQVGGGLWYDF